MIKIWVDGKRPAPEKIDAILNDYSIEGFNNLMHDNHRDLSHKAVVKDSTEKICQRRRMIRIWVDDERPAPEKEGSHYHYWFKSVNETLLNLGLIINEAQMFTKDGSEYLLDLDYDAGKYKNDGGDYVNILKALAQPWIKELLCFTEADLLENYQGKPWTKDMLDSIKIRFHSTNPIGIKNMRAIIKSCSWIKEEKGGKS